MLSCGCLLRFYQQFWKFYSDRLAPRLDRSGLTMLEAQVLVFLANNPGYDTARDVAQLRGLAKSQVSAAVETLSRRGILQRQPDGADRRVVHLAITEAGWPLAREIQQVQADCGRAVLTGLTAAEEAQLEQLVEKILKNAEQLSEGAGQVCTVKR